MYSRCTNKWFPVFLHKLRYIESAAELPSGSYKSKCSILDWSSPPLLKGSCRFSPDAPLVETYIDIAQSGCSRFDVDVSTDGYLYCTYKEPTDQQDSILPLPSPPSAQPIVPQPSAYVGKVQYQSGIDTNYQFTPFPSMFSNTNGYFYSTSWTATGCNGDSLFVTKMCFRWSSSFGGDYVSAIQMSYKNGQTVTVGSHEKANKQDTEVYDIHTEAWTDRKNSDCLILQGAFTQTLWSFDHTQDTFLNIGLWLGHWKISLYINHTLHKSFQTMRGSLSSSFGKKENRIIRSLMASTTFSSRLTRDRSMKRIMVVAKMTTIKWSLRPEEPWTRKSESVRIMDVNNYTVIIQGASRYAFVWDLDNPFSKTLSDQSWISHIHYHHSEDVVNAEVRLDMGAPRDIVFSQLLDFTTGDGRVCGIEAANAMDGYESVDHPLAYFKLYFSLPVWLY